MTFLEQGAIGERHVGGGDRLAIVKMRLGAQVEHHPATVVAVFDGACDQAIAGRGLIAGRVVLAGADHQGFVQLAHPVLQEVRRGDRA
ncbi:hypothetical protein D3C77_668630 [compost metagenome]